MTSPGWMGDELVTMLDSKLSWPSQGQTTMGSPINILVQTTIPAIAVDWNIDRFMLAELFKSSSLLLNIYHKVQG